MRVSCSMGNLSLRVRLPAQRPLLSARSRTIAFQAVGVAVIAAIIWLAFLRPADPGDLSGIDAEGSPPVAIAPKPEKSGRDEPRRPVSVDRPGRGRDDAAPGDALRGLPASGPGTGAGPLPPPLDDELTTPSTDQYDDLVAQLMRRVGNPALFRELGPQP